MKRLFPDGFIIAALFDDKERPKIIVGLIVFGIVCFLFFGLPYFFESK